MNKIMLTLTAIAVGAGSLGGCLDQLDGLAMQLARMIDAASAQRQSDIQFINGIADIGQGRYGQLTQISRQIRPDHRGLTFGPCGVSLIS